MRPLALGLLASLTLAGCGGDRPPPPCAGAPACDVEPEPEPDCALYYLQDSCVDGAWCKPTANGGTCVPPECGARSDATCTDGTVCVPVGPDAGACLVPCTYGFIGETYRDDCEDVGGVDYACQAAGVADKAACLPAGTLPAGAAGCDLATTPCAPGSVCVNVVCRTLCRENQGADCPVGETCIPVSPASDMFVCGVP